MKVKDVLLRSTNVGELCVICECGWMVAVAYIDHEDLCSCSISPRLLEETMLYDEWRDFKTISNTGAEQTIKAHYIYC